MRISEWKWRTKALRVLPYLLGFAIMVCGAVALWWNRPPTASGHWLAAYTASPNNPVNVSLILRETKNGQLDGSCAIELGAGHGEVFDVKGARVDGALALDFQKEGRPFGVFQGRFTTRNMVRGKFYMVGGGTRERNVVPWDLRRAER